MTERFFLPFSDTPIKQQNQHHKYFGELILLGHLHIKEDTLLHKIYLRFYSRFPIAVLRFYEVGAKILSTKLLHSILGEHIVHHWGDHVHGATVIPYDRLLKEIDRFDTYLSVPCPCLHLYNKKNEPDYKDIVNKCICIGFATTVFQKTYNKRARFINKDELKDLLYKLNSRGFFHLLSHCDNPHTYAICNCDKNCLAWRLKVKYDFPDAIISNNHKPKITDNCSGCGQCTDKCHFAAITIIENNGTKKAVISETKCTGCHLCLHACPSNGINVIEPDFVPDKLI